MRPTRCQLRHRGFCSNEPAPVRNQMVLTDSTADYSAFQKGVQGESNSRPLRPERRIMPLDHAPTTCTKVFVLGPGIEPGTYCVLGSRHNQLDQPSDSNPGGTRTPSLEIRSLTPYPVGPQGLDYWKWGGLGPRNGGHGTERTKIMVPPVGFEPTHLIRYLNLSQAP